MNKKALILAPSKSLINRKLGKIIDTYDIVCRINSSGLSRILTKYKEIVGTKKDIWFLGHIGIIHQDKNSYKNIITTNKDYYNKLKKEIKQLILCDENIINLANSKTTKVPTSGFLALFYMMSKYKDITICGFDGFKGGHFYGNEILNRQYYSDEISSKGYGRHNALNETKYINQLLKDNKIKEL